MVQERINVTQPPLPELDELDPYLQAIWSSKQLTNSGQFHNQLEDYLAKFLDVPFVSLFNNGTLALATAIQALDLRGEIITTPYTFAATPNSIWWNKLTPVFVDIEPNYCNIDFSKIEDSINEHTSAIMPVHVYGNPCSVNKIKKVAEKYDLRVIYDAAHAFGVKYKGNSLLNFGDLSVLSFHATKVFSTIEGGAIVSHDKGMKNRIDNLRNFGLESEENLVGPGLNSKLNEIQSVFGLVQLKHVDSYISKRQEIGNLYDKHLSQVPGIKVQSLPKDTVVNRSYYPIFIDRVKFGKTRDELYFNLQKNNVFCRRYFYPLVTDFSPYKDLKSSNKETLPVAYEMVERILCLPIYPDLAMSDVHKIISIIKD